MHRLYGRWAGRLVGFYISSSLHFYALVSACRVNAAATGCHATPVPVGAPCACNAQANTTGPWWRGGVAERLADRRDGRRREVAKGQARVESFP